MKQIDENAGLKESESMYEEVESVEELGNVKDYLTGVGVGVGIVVSVVTIT